MPWLCLTVETFENNSFFFLRVYVAWWSVRLFDKALTTSKKVFCLFEHISSF